MSTSKYINGSLSANTLNLKSISGGTSIVNLGIDSLGNVVSGTTDGSSFTGGTVSGETNFTGGLTANTISATTYYNLPTDINVTGGTFSAGTATFTNNTGGTFSVTGFTDGGSTTFTGGTVSGATNFTGGLTANTISATTISGNNIDSVNQIDFNTTATTTHLEGRVHWNDDIKSLEIDTENPNVQIQVGHEMVARVYNGTGTLLTKGTVVYINGVQGQRPTVTRADYSADTTSAAVIGFVAADINNGQNGYIVTYGFLENINTIAYSAGTPLYLFTGGTYSSNKPQAPNHDVRLGKVITSNATTGKIFVTIQNGYELDELHDVRITSATTNDVLVRSSYAGVDVWVNTKTLSGLTYVEATTISVDSIKFNTGSTISSPIAGEVYFDNVEKALSYNTSINEEVKVNLGQQNYIRVFNDSGTEISRGKVLEILSANSGLPSVTLAINAHTGFNVIGVSAENIPNNSEGIVITNGIISDIELTGMTIGSLVYASDTIPGDYVSDVLFSNFPLTARTNSVGYVIQTGTTTGKLFVNVNNENNTLSLTDLERNVLEGNVISTGAFEYTGMTLNSTTTFNVAPLKGWVVDNTNGMALTPNVSSINYVGVTNQTTPYINTNIATFVLITSASTLMLLNTFPTPQQRRENIYLGKVLHPDLSTIQNINNTVDYDVSPMSALRDMWESFNLINEGVVASPNGVNLNINTSYGILWGNGINWSNNQLSPNNVTLSATTVSTFQYRTQTGGTFTNTTTIDNTNYDVGGVVTPVPGTNAYTTQRIYLFSTGVIRIQYGQTYYTTLAKAIAALQTESFNVYQNNKENAVLIGLLTVRDGSTDLSNPNDAVFTFVSKFGEIFGGTAGLSTTSLQQAYNNSTTPEITTDSTLGPLSVKNGAGTADNVTNLYEAVNSGDGVTMFVRADGFIFGTTFNSGDGFTANGAGLTATTVSATTYQNLPIDPNYYVTGFSYSNNVFTIKQSGQSDLTALINNVTGWTVNGNLTVTGNTSSDLVKITQTGSGNAFVVEDSESPDTSMFVVDTSGNVGIGTNSPISKIQISNTATTVSSTLYNATNDFVTLTAQGAAPGFNIVSAGDAETNRGVFKATRSRGTLTTPLVPILNDDTLSLIGAIYDGVTNYSTAGITFEVDGTVTASTAPQRIVLSTGTGSTRTERMRINSEGNVGIGTGTLSPQSPLHVRANSVPSTNETILRLDVLDSPTAYFAVNNGSTIDGVFVPEIIGRQASTTGLNAAIIGGYIDPLQDSGTSVPVTVFRSAVVGNTTVSTRPLFDFRNWTTSVMLMSASGDVGIGTTSPSEKLHVSGNAIITGTTTSGSLSATTISSGTISGDTMVITSTPTTDNTNTQVLTRDPITGIVELVDISSIASSFNYGLANAIMTGNFLT